MRTEWKLCGAVMVMSAFGAFAAWGGLFRGGGGDEEEQDAGATTEIAADEALPGQPGPGNYRRFIKYGGRERFYDIHVPASYKPGQAVPLVVSFHGFMGNPVQQRKDSGLDAVADKNGFIVVYPAGTSRMTPKRFLTWNVGRGTKVYAVQENVDDIGFVKRFLEETASMFSVDPKRVYASGFSQGAAFTYRVSAELGDKFAAIGTVGGVPLVDEGKLVAAGKLPLINFQAVNDPICSFTGGVREDSGDPLPRPGAREAIKLWTKRNGIKEDPVEKGAVGQAEFVRYGGDGEAEVISWTLNQGGHVWPGGQSSLPERMVGPMNSDINASQLMWEFFSRHSRP